MVQNRRADGWSAEAAWRLTVTHRIGSAEGVGHEAFGRVVDVGIDVLGRVWVADGMQQQILVFEPDGRFVRALGRKGAGPAEFQGIAGFDWSPEGTLWVLDGGNNRFAVYDTAGQLVATPPRVSSVTLSPWPGGFDRYGRLTDVGGRRVVGGTMASSLVRISFDDGAADTLLLAPVREEFFGAITSGDARNQHIKQAPIPFTGRQIWAVDPEGDAWVAVTDRYQLERRGFDGTLKRVIELDNTARRVSRADKDQILGNYRWFEQAGGKLDRSRVPDHHPHLLNLFIDGEGHVWVFPTYFRGEKPLIDVFGADGRYLGQVQAPTPFLSHPAPAIRGNLVAAVARDADGVDDVVLMRLEKP